jgi:hypothetical protein
LTAVNELQLFCLSRHRRRDLDHSMPDEIYGRGSGEIEISFIVRIPQINTFTAHRWRKSLAEGTPENGGIRRRINHRGFRHVSDYPAACVQVSKR